MDNKFKSDEEKQFYAWLIESESNGLISGVEYEPYTWGLSPRVSIQIEKKLKTKTKVVDKFLLHPHGYTPDFVFVVNHTPLLNQLIKIDWKEKGLCRRKRYMGKPWRHPGVFNKSKIG